MKNPIESLCWSIGLPGFGQYLNGHIFKGTVFIFLEILINVQAKFNLVILHSFQGNIEKAIELTKYQWLLFYPCVYFYAMWDAYKGAGGGKGKFDYFPFVFSAYFVTISTIYSTKLTIFGVLLGPVWLGFLFLIQVS